MRERHAARGKRSGRGPTEQPALAVSGTKRLRAFEVLVGLDSFSQHQGAKGLGVGAHGVYGACLRWREFTLDQADIELDDFGAQKWHQGQRARVDPNVAQRDRSTMISKLAARLQHSRWPLGQRALSELEHDPNAVLAAVDDGGQLFAYPSGRGEEP